MRVVVACREVNRLIMTITGQSISSGRHDVDAVAVAVLLFLHQLGYRDHLAAMHDDALNAWVGAPTNGGESIQRGCGSGMYTKPS
jgi:hypothetical protein